MSLIIHPEFDPTTATWFWDEYEAPTLRELSALLGPAVVIADYYPRGIDITVRELRLTREQVIWHCRREARLGKRAAASVPHEAAATPRTTRSSPRPHVRRHDYELILRLRAEGRTYRQIRDEVPTHPGVQTVGNICHKARAAGDDRALPGRMATRRALSHQKDRRSEQDVQQAS